MIVLYFVLPLALVLAGLACWAFMRATRQGQFDDLDTPPLRVLFDEEARGAGR
jgi:cbb3-type cytochrome oxidase maturation protein